MRPAHLLRHNLQRDQVRLSPVLAFSIRHPDALRINIDQPCNFELRRSRTVISLALALQDAMAEYQADELERVEIDHRNGAW